MPQSRQALATNYLIKWICTPVLSKFIKSLSESTRILTVSSRNRSRPFQTPGRGTIRWAIAKFIKIDSQKYLCQRRRGCRDLNTRHISKITYLRLNSGLL